MTTRLKGLTITLDHNIREDDAQRIIDAISMVKGVMSIKAIESNADDYIIEQRIRNEIGRKLLDIIYPKDK
jgi:hypothetical protein